MDPFQALFNQYVTPTQDNRYFLPLSKSNVGQSQMITPPEMDAQGLYPNTDRRPYYGIGDENRYYSLEDYYNALDPSQVGIIGSGRQDALSFPSAQRGNYNGELGYYVDPNGASGSHPATTMGQKGTESGLSQFLLSSLGMYLGGSLGGAGSAGGSAAGEATGSTLGESIGSGFGQGMGAEAGSSLGSSVGSAAGSAAGAAGSSTLEGNAGTDTLTGSESMGEEYDPYNYQGGNTNEGYSYNTEPPAGTDSLWDTLKQYYGNVKTALGAYNTIKGGNSGGGSLLGAGLGGLLGGLSGGSKPAGTTTTIQDIPDWQKALLMPALSQSYGLLQQQQGQSYPLLNSAQDTLGKTISGGFLNSNPYLDATYNQAAKSVTDNYNSVVRPQNDAMFYKAGAFGPSNSAYDETVARNQFGLGQNLQNLATNIYGGNFAQERQNQLNASINAPAFSQAASATQWSPYQNFLSVAGGNFGGSQQSPYFQNKTGNIFGGALLGSQLFK